MNARSLHRMALGRPVIQGGSHAQSTLYGHEPGGPRPRGRVDLEAFRHGRFQCQVHGDHPASGRVRGGGPFDFGLRGLCALGQSAFCRNGAAGLVDDPACLCRTATPRQSRALAGDLPKALRKRKQRFAIDLHLVPYYGEPCADPKEIYRSQAKAGTNNFHAYASAYVVCHGQRFTVALTPVERGEKMKTVVQRLLALARRAGLRPRLLLLDRGFYSVDVVRYLQRARVPFLMPAVARGRRPAEGQPTTGIRAFQLWKRGGWGQHQLTSGKTRATVLIAVHCGNYRGQWKKHGRYAWVYAYWGFKPASTRWIADTYRQRFGIEASYRQLNEAQDQDVYPSAGSAVFLHRLSIDPAECLGVVALADPVEPAPWLPAPSSGTFALQGAVAMVAAGGRSRPRRDR